MNKKDNYSEQMERKIDMYVNGELNDQEIDELWAELIQDEYYLDYLKSVANLKKVVRDTKKGPARVFYITAQQKLRYIAAAAAVVLMVASYTLFDTNRQQDATTLEPIASIELDYYRSSTGTLEENDSEDLIREAIILANNGQYLEAIQFLDHEIAKTDDIAIIAALNINAGSIMYNTGMYRDAALRFTTVVEDQEADILVRERAYWYLGNTYFQLNQFERAREAFRSAYELNGAYSRIAESYLKALASAQ